MQKLFTPTTVAGWAGMRCCQYFSIKRNLTGIIRICYVMTSLLLFLFSGSTGVLPQGSILSSLERTLGTLTVK